MKQFLTKNITGKPEEVFHIPSPKSSTANKQSAAAFEPIKTDELSTMPLALNPDQVALRNAAVNHMQGANMKAHFSEYLKVLKNQIEMMEQ